MKNQEQETQEQEIQKSSSENHRFRPKWYFSYPILILTFFFCLPCSLILSIVRLLIVKDPKKGYKIRSIIAVLLNAGFFLLISSIIFFSAKWEREYKKYIEAGEYQNAREVLDDHFDTALTEGGVDCYLKVFELSDDYQNVDDIVLKYYETLNDKTTFQDSVFDKIDALSDKLNEEQLNKIKGIRAEVETAKEEKAKQIEEESRAKAESESIKAAEESKARAESESIKAAEESRARAESESIKAAEESKARAESESVKAAEESIKAAEESIKVAEESKAREESESVKATKETKAREESESAKATKETRAREESESAKAAKESKTRAESKLVKAVEQSRAKNKSKTNGSAKASIDKGSTQKNNHQINEAVRTEKFEFTVTNAYVLEDLGSNKKVPEGAVYVVIEFTYKNISKQPISSWSLPRVYLMDKNDAKYSSDLDASWYFDGYSDEKILSDMNPNIKTKGAEIFEVSMETLSEGEMKAYIKADKELIFDLDLAQTSSFGSDHDTAFSYGYGNVKADSFYEEDIGRSQAGMIDPDTPYYSDIGDTMVIPHVIIEDSSTRYLKDADIYWMTPEQLRYAKNEIYARHGRKFQDAQLQAWFDSQDWYYGRIEPKDFKDDMLSAIEKANIQVIQHRLEVNSQ